MSINFKNTETHYGQIGRSLHWISVALLVAVIIIAGQFEDMDVSSEKLELIILHSSIGLVFFLLMLVRLIWRNININPIKSYSIKNWQKITATSLHKCIYIVVITQSIIGIMILLTEGKSIHFFNLIELVSLMEKNELLFEFFKASHTFISIMIYPMFLIHITAAIYHQIFGVAEDD